MYRKQMTAQKLICYAAIIISAVVFIYALGIMTDLYDALYSTMRNSNDLTNTDVPGSIVYYNMQDFNSQFVIAGIVMILLGVLLFITNTHVRRKYYIGNLFATAVYSVAGVITMVWAHGQIEIYKAQFLQIDFAALKEHAETWNTLYTESTFWFDLHYPIFLLVAVVIVLLIVNYVWKINLMNAEQALLKNGKGASA